MKHQHVWLLDFDSVSCEFAENEYLLSILRRYFPGCQFSSPRVAPVRGLDSARPDLTIARVNHFAPAESLGPVRDHSDDVPILALVCSHLRRGARLAQADLESFDDFCICPFSDADLIVRVERLLQRSDARSNPDARADLVGLDLGTMIGESEAFVQALAKIPLLLRSDATLLIEGETGTGKELFARSVHYNGTRRSKPFIPVNCGALPDHLFENEFFGHTRGAFTDAHRSENGLVAEAEGGTIFLDEVDTLSLAAQTKLLRFLQDWEYRPLGTARARVANVRLISATNSDLRGQVKAGHFREDLFHRLNILSLFVPPLRERVSDIPLLARYFLEIYAARYGRQGLCFTFAALQRLGRYSWPGNVREMESLIHRAVVLNCSREINACDLELPTSVMAQDPAPNSLRSAKSQVVDQFEKEYLTNLLVETQGNLSRAARVAGTERRAFQRLVRKHGIERQTFNLPI